MAYAKTSPKMMNTRDIAGNAEEKEEGDEEEEVEVKMSLL